MNSPAGSAGGAGRGLIEAARQCQRRRGRAARLAAALAATLALGLGGCGQKGPLYLPNVHKTPVTPPAGAASPAGVAPDATPLVVPTVPGSGSGKPGATSGAPTQSSPGQTPSQPTVPRQSTPDSQSGPGAQTPATSAPAPAA